MGLIISRFRRKKTTTDILENLETQIKSIEQDGQFKEETYRRVVSYVMAYSAALYLLFIMLYYFMLAGRSQNWLHSLLHASPLLLLPALILFLRSAISKYYNWTINKNTAKLKKLKAEKKKILEEVMNTETYKVAKEILDKYGGPEEQSKAKPFTPLSLPGSNHGTPGQAPQLRQRLAIQNSSTPLSSLVSNNNQIVPVNMPLGGNYKGPRLASQHLPRPLPDRNRSALDKVVDYLLKDGPNHRMALICAACYAHNGMAMAEEFEYVSYCCAYCGHMNPARKQRPVAPPLTPIRALPAPRRSITGGGDDTPTASSGSDSEGEHNDSTVAASDDGTVTAAADGELNRSPSPAEEEAKSEQEKKED